MRRRGGDFSLVRGPALLFCKTDIIVNPPLVKGLLRIDSDVKLLYTKKLTGKSVYRLGRTAAPLKNSCRKSFKMLLMGRSSSLLDARCLRQHRLLLAKHN